MGLMDYGEDRTDKGAVLADSDLDFDYAVGSYIVSESGVDLEAFTGPGGSLCGLVFWGTVITQPSSSTTSDLKDLLGPRRFNFGSLTFDASLEPTCATYTGDTVEKGQFFYSVDDLSGPGLEEIPETPGSECSFDSDCSGGDACINGYCIADVSCDWTFTHTTTSAEKTSSACSGRFILEPTEDAGEWNGTVTVAADVGVQCEDTQDIGEVLVYHPLEVTADLSGGCAELFTYATPSVTGGSGDYSYAPGWNFTCLGASALTPSSTMPSGTVGVQLTDAAPTTCTGTLTVTDNRTDVTIPTSPIANGCVATDSAQATVYAPIQVSITPDATSLTCPAIDTAGDDITFNAAVSGGDGNYTYNWTGCSSMTAMCTVDPNDSDFCADETVYLTVDDGTTECAAQDSDMWEYEKQTTVTATPVMAP
jgi:hypothetical protein